ESPIDSPESVTVWRNGNIETIPLTIAESPLDQPVAATKPSGSVQHARAELPDLGLQTAPMNDDARTKYKLAPDSGGVVVTAVAPNSSAFEGGLQPGDVLLRVQETAISTPEALQQTLDAARKDQRPYVVLLVQNHDSLRWVPLPVGSAP
ncbi:MAG: PDZ domain-containing protein, partial [Acetobacteraceae bacterium]